LKTLTWDEVREFLQHDRWTADRKRSTDHDYFTKTLPDGEILITKVSRSSQTTMSPGRFKAILSDQLRLGEAQFWEVLRTKTPSMRPGSISEFYLSTALEEADPDPRTISDLLDRIPGALEHAQGGVGEARSGLGTPLEDL